MKLFDSIKLTKPKLNKFDLSHERKFSMKMGKLVPILVQDVVPGDKFRVNTEQLLRLAPMLAPVMHRVNVFTHYFFVPNRLVWNAWEDFITGGPDGTSSPTIPYLIFNNTNQDKQGYSSLMDYMGLPVFNGSGPYNNSMEASALPFRAYQMIFNEYYRDQNLVPKVPFELGSGNAGDDYNELCQIRQRAWEKDYFTSALPFAQKGAPVDLPLSATVSYLDESLVKDAGGNDVAGNTLMGTSSGSDGILAVDKSNLTDPGTAGRVENIDSVDIDPLTINELRRSVRLQEWLEKNARGGSRYIEQILAHFGVRSSDSRLQRPEYLGGGKNPVVISEVLSTYQTDGGDLPQGNMAGHGIAVGNSNRFSKTFEEHGYIIGIMSVLPRTAYQQGIPRHFHRYDKFDYFWPEFANLGEQEIKNNELFFRFADAPAPDTTFGYQSRYAEYKFQNSSVHGAFKNSLSFWHMGRIFDSAPALNESFVSADPTKRIFAVEDPAVDELYVQLYNEISALRPMPYFGTPTL